MSPHFGTPHLLDADARFDRRLNDIGWGLLLMLTGAIWAFPPERVPEGTWLLGVAAILLGVNVARYRRHIAVSGFSVMLGLVALAVAVGQMWGINLPLLAILLLLIGASLLARPLLTRTS